MSFPSALSQCAEGNASLGEQRSSQLALSGVTQATDQAQMHDASADTDTER